MTQNFINTLPLHQYNSWTDLYNDAVKTLPLNGFDINKEKSIKLYWKTTNTNEYIYEINVDFLKARCFDELNNIPCQ